jgi:Icc-related predicted phosphoesterase
LIHCGDYSNAGYGHEIKSFFTWLEKQPAKHKIVINGNHELGFEANPKLAHALAKECCPDVHILNNSMITIEGINIYGYPETPYFLAWAYNRARTPAEVMLYGKPLMKDITDKIPTNTHILLTHGPAYGILDQTVDNRYVGCDDLLSAINRVRPDLHFFGHIHHCGGREFHYNGTSHYNAAICDERYFPSNPVTVVEYDLEQK